jgi:hypothetical protein
MALPKKIRVGDIRIEEGERDRLHSRSIQASWVNHLMDALQAGGELPPLVVEAGTNRSVGGAHTAIAYRKLYGDNHLAPVIWMGPFATDQEFLLESTRQNNAHGLKLTETDQTRIIGTLRQYGVETREIAGALNLPDTRVLELEARIAYTPATQMTLPFNLERQPDHDQPQPSGTTAVAMSSTGTPVVLPLKADTRHWAGQFVEDSRVVAARKGSPRSGYKTIVSQLVRALHTDILSREDATLLALLRDLQDALTDYLSD